MSTTDQTPVRNASAGLASLAAGLLLTNVPSAASRQHPPPRQSPVFAR